MTCTDTKFGYVCECENGYTLTGELCIDTNECLAETRKLKIYCFQTTTLDFVKKLPKINNPYF